MLSPALYIRFSLFCDSRAVAELFSRLILDGHNYFTNPVLEIYRNRGQDTDWFYIVLHHNFIVTVRKSGRRKYICNQ